MSQPCLVHRYGEPDAQGYVSCWSCGHTFNLADDNDDDEDYDDYVDSGDDVVMSYDPDDDEDFPRYDDEDDNFERCSSCDGHDACADFGCAIQMGLGHLVNPDGL